MRSRVVRGVAWKVGSQTFRQVSRMAVAIILARLLTPHDFGLAAMVIVFSGLVLVFSDLGLGAALVQRTMISEADRSTVFWTSAAVGVGFTVLGVGASWWVADFYGEPEVQPLFAALSLGFFVTALGTTQATLLKRDMDFRALELRQMGATVAGAVVGITLAALAYGPWAIIGQQLAVAVASTVLLWSVSPWRPRFTYSRGSLRSLGGFGASVFGTRLLFYAQRNADNILIGRFLGPTALGAYALAYNVMLAPVSRVLQPVAEVLFPAMSRMEGDRERIARAWFQVTRLVGAITIPTMLGLIIVAPEFVHVVLGKQWSEAVPVIQILAWVGLIQSLQMNTVILQALGRARTTLWQAAFSVAVSLVAFATGLNWGIVGVATAYAIAVTIVEPLYTWRSARVLGVSLFDFARNLAGVSLASAGMAACVLVVDLVMPSGRMPDAARLLLLIAVGVAGYALLCSRLAPQVFADLRALRKRRTSPPTPTDGQERAGGGSNQL
jgi:O-antigen/teichoic acid export membrane protein